MPLFGDDIHLSKWSSQVRHLNQAEVQLWHVSPFSVEEMCLRVSREFLWRSMKCGSLQTPSRSPFTEMEWRTAWMVQYLICQKIQAWAFSSWFPVTLTPSISPSAKDVHVSVQTLAWSDLWQCGYKKRIKWIVCMCSLLIANTNEKWAHPLPLGFSLLAHFSSPYTTASPFHTVKHLERVMATTQPQERQVSAPQDHTDLEKTLQTRTTAGVRKILFMDRKYIFLKYFVVATLSANLQ